jgi:Cu(I)-responsive transcriptional regulator
MNIAEAAKKAGLTPKAIRFYEAQGLLRPRRSSNGYRAFGEPDVHALRFLKRARTLGFSVDECREMLGLYHDHDRPGAEVKRLAGEQIAEIDRRLQELKSIRTVLETLVEHCGTIRPDYPVLDEKPAAVEQRPNNDYRLGHGENRRSA